MTRPMAVALPTTGARPAVPSTIETWRAFCGRPQRLDGFVGELGQIEGSLQVEPSALDAGEQEQVVDERRQRFDVALHRPQVTLGLRRHAVGHRLHGGAQRRPVACADRGRCSRTSPAVPRRAGRAALECVETLGQLVERLSDVAELVGPLQPGAHRAVTRFDAAHRLLEPPGIAGERSRGEQDEDGGEHGRQRQHADCCHASPASSTISRASTTAAIAPMASEPNVTTSRRLRSERVRWVTPRSTTPPPTAAPSAPARRAPSRRLPSRLEPVADTTSRRDPARLVRVDLQLLAQAADVHRHRRRILVLGRRVPHPAEQLAREKTCRGDCASAYSRSNSFGVNVIPRPSR